MEREAVAAVGKAAVQQAGIKDVRPRDGAGLSVQIEFDDEARVKIARVVNKSVDPVGRCLSHFCDEVALHDIGTRGSWRIHSIVSSSASSSSQRAMARAALSLQSRGSSARSFVSRTSAPNDQSK